MGKGKDLSSDTAVLSSGIAVLLPLAGRDYRPVQMFGGVFHFDADQFPVRTQVNIQPVGHFPGFHPRLAAEPDIGAVRLRVVVKFHSVLP